MRYRLRALTALAATFSLGVTVALSGGASAAGTSGLTPPEAHAQVPSSVGKGEGKLNLIAWEGYAQPKWVKPFEKATGCQVSAKYAGTSSEMVSLMANGGGHQYDLVSASGDADLRLIYGGDVRPINISLIPSWKQFRPFLQAPTFNTIGGKHYGVSYEFGPNVLLYSTKTFKAAPGSWSVLYSGKYKGEITVPDNPIQIADAALYLESAKPSLKITDPYELTQPQFNASVALLKSEHPLIKKYWDLASQEISLFQSHTTVVGAAWPYQTNTLKANKVAVSDTIPKEGRDRLGRHVDDGDQRATPELRLQVDAVGDHPEGPGPGGRLLRRDSGQHPGLRLHGQDRQGLVRGLSRQRTAELLQDDQVLEDPAGHLRQRQERLRAVPELGGSLDADHLLSVGRAADDSN